MLEYITYLILGASHPVLANGTWLVVIAIKHSIRGDVTFPKAVNISVTVVREYGYDSQILQIFGISLLGVLIPVVARLIFNAGHLVNILVK